jgi:hypothetical protein
MDISDIIEKAREQQRAAQDASKRREEIQQQIDVLREEFRSLPRPLDPEEPQPWEVELRERIKDAIAKP